MLKRHSLAPVTVLLAAVVLCVVVAAAGTALRGSDVLSPTGTAGAAADAPPLTVYFLDVGQADAALLCSEGEAILIDAGNDEDRTFVLSFLEQKGVDRLTLAVGTHGHEDHIGALDEVIAAVPTEQLLLSPVPADTKTYRNLLAAAERAKVPVTYPAPGDQFSFGCCDMTVLGPIGVFGEDYEDLNDSSLSLLVSCGETTFFFTGDMERPMELILLDNWDLQEVDVLKVGHHGSGDATCYPFLRALMPTYAVISVGADNPYGHPHENLLSRLRDADATVLRTDQLGTITLVSDGQTVRVVSP